MRSRTWIGLGLFATVVVSAALVARRPTIAVEPPHARGIEPASTMVLVELFTSEGCSSCPPADAVLARLERTQPIANVGIVPVAFHVDYWNDLGWPDPFSSADATTRQRAYRALNGSVYTPQAVIDGTAEALGSREDAIVRAVTEASKRPHASIAIDVTSSGLPLSSKEISVRVGALPDGAASDAELHLVVTRKTARIEVQRGENGGRTLDHTAIARELQTLGTVPKEGAALRASLRPHETPRDLRVVAFVQERKSHRVLGASMRELETP